jgi:hypothetical protein
LRRDFRSIPYRQTSKCAMWFGPFSSRRLRIIYTSQPWLFLKDSCVVALPRRQAVVSRGGLPGGDGLVPGFQLGHKALLPDQGKGLARNVIREEKADASQLFDDGTS